jgi:putative redox protein
MGQMKTEIIWNQKMSFTGIGGSGHEVKMDASAENGGENTGARPMELLLHGLGGCTGIDIIMILEKMRQHAQSFRIEIEGTRAEEPPRRYTTIHIHYILEGDLLEEKVRKAIELSEEKYCSASKSLNAKISSSFSINGQRYE